MPAHRFNRQPGKRRFSKIFVVAAEGKNTERTYFGMFSDRRLFPGRDFVVQIVRSDSDSAPPRLLDRMKTHIERENPDPPFEAWLVVEPIAKRQFCNSNGVGRLRPERSRPRLWSIMYAKM
jgi:hypothetical protein